MTAKIAFNLKSQNLTNVKIIGTNENEVEIQLAAGNNLFYASVLQGDNSRVKGMAANGSTPGTDGDLRVNNSGTLNFVSEEDLRYLKIVCQDKWEAKKKNTTDDSKWYKHPVAIVGYLVIAAAIIAGIVWYMKKSDAEVEE